MSEFVSRWLTMETAENAHRRTDKTDKINSVSSVSAAESDSGRFQRRDVAKDPGDCGPSGSASDFANLHTDHQDAAFVPLGAVIAQSVASNKSVDVEARLVHAEAMAARWPDSLLHAQVVRDWLQIKAVKEAGLGPVDHPVDPADNAA
jgi:hypothetical protein